MTNENKFLEALKMVLTVPNAQQLDLKETIVKATQIIETMQIMVAARIEDINSIYNPENRSGEEDELLERDDR